MKIEDLLSKLRQIEEQARLTLEEFPKTLTKERQRMIIALAKHVRSELGNAEPEITPTPATLDPSLAELQDALRKPTT
jgi:hypothetical protein